MNPLTYQAYVTRSPELATTTQPAGVAYRVTEPGAPSRRVTKQGRILRLQVMRYNQSQPHPQGNL